VFVMINGHSNLPKAPKLVTGFVALPSVPTSLRHRPHG
jgi:hypothetical protein